MKARDLMLELIIEIRKITDLVAAQITPVGQTLELLTNLQSKQNSIDLKLTQITSTISSLESNYQTLLNTKAEWELVDQDINALETELVQLREMNANGALSKHPSNCEGLLGYEAEGPGDGLLGKYYNNEDFLGKTTDRTDEHIDFTWENESPAPNINEENFSIKWASWLRIPTTGKYTFFTESDGGNSLYVNSQALISHFMGSSSVAGPKKENSWLDSNVGNLKEGRLEENSGKRNKEQIISTSGHVYLNGGMKYKLDYLMYHSVHTENTVTGLSFGRLYWSSDQIEKQLVNENFFYTSNKIPPLKVSGLNPTLMTLAVLKENENAFKDSDEYKMQDIPFQYQNKPAIRLNIEFAETVLSLSSTSPIVIYIAVDVNRPNPLPTEFEDQQEGLSVLKVLKTAKVVDHKVKASESNLYKIYRRKFPAGKIKVPLILSKKAPTHRMIVFYSLDPVASSPVSCGGETVLISNPNSPAFQKCEVSSKIIDEGWNCEASLSGKMNDNDASMWASNGQGIGAWISIKFKAQYQITKIQVKDRSGNERNSKLELSFGSTGGDPIVIDLKNIDEIQEFPIPPVVASEIKITVKSVYSTINNGGSFNIYGIACMDSSKLSNTGGSKTQNDEKRAPIKVQCSDTFRNKDNFERMNVKEGDSVKIICEETCALSNVAIYGDGIYSEDSSLCKAAFHAGVLSKAGDKLKVAIVRGESFYKSSERNGVKSSSKQVSGVGVQFQMVKSKESNENLKPGMKLDIYDGQLQKWLPGIIESAEKISIKFTKLTIKKEGYSAENNEIIQWPNKEKLVYCGEMVKDRNCDKNSTNPNSLASQQVKIQFAPGAPKVQGYLIDQGKEFNKKGDLEYGWSRDVSTLARTRNINSDPLLDNLLLFPPDVKSKWCAEKTPDMSCENVDWSIKVAAGKYNVKITVGDPINKAQYDLKVNDKEVLKNKILAKNQFFTTNDDFVVLEGIIRLVAVCEGDCKYSWSRINAIEINKLPGFLLLNIYNYFFNFF